MMPIELLDHIAAGESQTLAFKASFDKACIATLVASANHALALNEISDLYVQSLQLSWDAYEAQGYTTNQLSVVKIQRFLRLVNQHGRFAVDETAPLAALHKLHYLNNSQPTCAALLLFAEEPIRHNVHIGRCKTPDMIIDDRQFTDTLF